MRALIADDDRTGTVILARALERLGLELVVAHDGEDAWHTLNRNRNFARPSSTGSCRVRRVPELCRRIRQSEHHAHMYVILLTARDSRNDMVTGLDAGSDDYLIKPFDPEELRARAQVGIRIATLQKRLTERVEELQDALSRVKQLSGLLPICSYCKRIRNDENYWEQLDRYVAEHSDAQFSHGICPTCFDAVRGQFEQ